MSQISDLLKKNEPALTAARLDAITIVLSEVIKVLSPEQRKALNESILTNFPTVKNASPNNPYTRDYQLTLFTNKLIKK